MDKPSRTGRPAAAPRSRVLPGPAHLALAGAAVAAAMALVPPAGAFPQYRAQAVKQLHLAPDRGELRVVGCEYCHVSPQGGAPWNPFGQLVQDKLGGDFAATLYAALEANKDSDGDGYEDVLEVFAGTRPGDKASRPLVDPAFLRKNFEAAGGLKLYRP